MSVSPLTFGKAPGRSGAEATDSKHARTAGAAEGARARRRRGQVFTRGQLLEAVWGLSDYIDPSTVTVHIRRLREKIEADPAEPHRLLTVWGIGYKLEP